MFPGSGVARLGGVGARLCGCATVPPVFLLSRWPPGVRSRLGGASLLLCFFFGGGVACSTLCLPWAAARTGWQMVWLTGSLLALWVAAGRALAPCVVWVMYMHGLVARPVGLGCGSAGWTVVRAGFVRSWARVLGCPMSPHPCGVGLVVAGLSFWW